MSQAAHAFSRPAEEPGTGYYVKSIGVSQVAQAQGRPSLRLARTVHQPPGHGRVRKLTLLFLRNPEHDHQGGRVRYEGYHICWPDGAQVGISLRRFCQQGSRLLGLGRHMRGKSEQLVEVGLHPVDGLDAPLTRLGPGIRTRRFYIEREHDAGRIFFFNGSPTEVEFDVGEDDPRILRWLGLPDLRHREQLWFDLSARSVEAV